MANGSGKVAIENWIQTDEAADVAGSVRHAIRAAQFARDDPLAWKWVALALHSALQGACVCHLTTTAAPVGVPGIAKLIARIIEDILQIGWAFRHQESAQRQELLGGLHTLATMDWPG